MSSTVKYNTRIAPSPTGTTHVGTARTALFNWLAARATGGSFLLRIDDTDGERNKPEYVDVILQSMEWLGLDYDDMFYQSKRLPCNYLDPANALVEAGYAIRLDNGAIALKWHDWMGNEPWQDSIAGEMPFTQTNIDQIDGRLILLRGGDKLGLPTYQFASVVDDYDYSINFVIRGGDHISNTPKQVAIWRALQRLKDRDNQPLPKFAHVGLIFKDKKKMSKRDGAASLLDYRDKDYNPEALFSFLVRLGWSPKIDNKENSLITRERALKMFLTEGNMRNVNANFDPQKLEYLQRYYSKKAA
jgi:glutamyl/glutaminyl-tRNA synthetase